MGSIIDISLVEAQLEAYTATTKLEFSGFGWGVREQRGEDSVLKIYRVELLDVGSYGYTQINVTGAQIARWSQEPDYKNLHLWFHRHPVDGWSGQDSSTCRTEPLGGSPDMLKWAAAIVRTPKGWIGRIDTFGPKGMTLHVPVAPNYSVLALQQMGAIITAKEEVKAALEAKNKKWKPSAKALDWVEKHTAKLADDYVLDNTDDDDVLMDEAPLPDVMCPYCACPECYDIGFGTIECSDCTSQFTRADLKAKRQAENDAQYEIQDNNHSRMWNRVFGRK